MTNHEIAIHLRHQAHELSRRKSNLYRVRAYRRAAQSLDYLQEEIAPRIQQEGPEVLRHLPGIGESLSETILALVQGVPCGEATSETSVACRK
jgi:DNA polymerase/3'-5' exonuclease PolX